MPLRSIIVIFIRIAALQYVASALLSLIPYIALKNLDPTILLLLGLPLLAALCWALAERIAQWVTCGHETSIPLGGLTRMDLFAFAFVYLGLSFLIGGIGSVGMNLCTAFVNAMSVSSAQQALLNQSVQQITKPLIQVILGIICLFNANRFAKKLVEHGQ